MSGSAEVEGAIISVRLVFDEFVGLAGGTELILRGRAKGLEICRTGDYLAETIRAKK
jgi:hypothetical protein